MLMVQWAVKARNHPERKSTEVVTVSAGRENQVLFGQLRSAQHILRARSPDDCGVSLECDMRNIQYVVVMRVGYEYKVRSLDMFVDSRYVRRRDIIPTIQRARVSGRSGIRCSAGRLWSKYSRNVRINQDDGGPVADFPPCRPQPPENDLSALFAARRVLSRKGADHCPSQSNKRKRKFPHRKPP